MKLSFLCTMLFFYTSVIVAQNQIQLAGKKKVNPADNYWDLEKYLWSHAHAVGSKPIIDFDALDHWVSLVEDQTGLALSQNGEYVAYGVISNIESRANGYIDTLVVQSTSHAWRSSFAGAQPGFFSANNQWYIFLDKDNKLCFLQTKIGEQRYIEHVSTYKSPRDGKNEWIAYQLQDADNTVQLQNLLTSREESFKKISAFSFDNSSQWLVLQSSESEQDLYLYNLQTGKTKKFSSITSFLFAANGQAILFKTPTGLVFANLANNTLDTLWSPGKSSEILENYTFDGTGRKIVWVVKDTSLDYTRGSQSDRPSTLFRTIWYWREGMRHGVQRVSDQTAGLGKGVSILGEASFIADGSCILFKLQAAPDKRPLLPDAAEVDIWSHRDTILQSIQLLNVKEPVVFQALINAENGQLIWTDNKFEQLKFWFKIKDYVLVSTINNGPPRPLKYGDRFWKKDYWKDSLWVLSLQNGQRRFFTDAVLYNEIWASPDSLYLVYFDRGKGHYFSYHLADGKQMDITAGIPAKQLGIHDVTSRFDLSKGRGVSSIYWLPENTSMLVYDEYDIWQLDYTGKKAPVNITNGYGRSHKIMLRWLEERWPGSVGSSFFLGKDTLLLQAFNTQTKWSGYFRKSLGSAGNPELLYMGPYFMNVLPGVYSLHGGMPPFKARQTRTWIIQRESVMEAPNYFVTQDFKSFTPLTDLQPHKRYNWLQAELHTFKQLDGTLSQGVLYKPENFDATKRYPVIISFYGPLSDRRFQYPPAQYITAPSVFDEPAWMVSHGYLVFIPDIHFMKNQWGPSTVNTVDGAARYLGTLPYVDGKHLGACGHSNSGRLGYYLLTHSHSFAAMSLGSGFGGADVINIALSLDNANRGENALQWAEEGAYGAALGPLWQNKTSWIDHTAVLQADRITSPVLLVHNKNDGDDIRTTVELFISLRRLEKKAWWLQFDKGDHSVIPFGKDPKDLTLRFTQFFDHYLKEAPAPRWMTQGLPAKLKGLEARYELDTAGKCGPDCIICKKWNTTLKKDPLLMQKVGKE